VSGFTVISNIGLLNLVGKLLCIEFSLSFDITSVCIHCSEQVLVEIARHKYMLKLLTELMHEMQNNNQMHAPW
jgi:hypothetical protein